MSERYCVSYNFAGFRDLKPELIPEAYRRIRRKMKHNMRSGLAKHYSKYKVIRKEIRWEDFGAKYGGGNGPPERAPKTLKSALSMFERPVLTICYWIKPT